MRLQFLLCRIAFLMLGAMAAPNAVAAQLLTADPTPGGMTREALTALLHEYENTLSSPAYSEQLRSQAKRDAARLRERLERGDFQVGDQIALQVEGEQELSKTFVVGAGPSITLPTIGTVSLRGVLRSELEPHLRSTLARYIRNPIVQAQSSIRIAVMGSIGKPGYYVVPTDLVLSDLLMLVGGPAPDADLRALWVERDEQRIWEGKLVQSAISQGQTLDQLGIRGGDQVSVPARRGGVAQALQPVLMVLGPLSLLLSLFLR